MRDIRYTMQTHTCVQIMPIYIFSKVALCLPDGSNLACFCVSVLRMQEEREKEAQLRGQPKLDKTMASIIIQKVHTHACTCMPQVDYNVYTCNIQTSPFGTITIHVW